MQEDIRNPIGLYAGAPSPLAAASRAIAAGDISCVDLAEHCLARIAASEPRLRAFLTIRPETVLNEARGRDREQDAGNYRGPLHGIPIAVKDIVDVLGYPTTAGSRLLPDSIARSDADIIAALRGLGAVVIGKANTHEFAFGATTPPTRNPWDPERIAGGSSGGSAAAVAAGFALIGVGTDTGGSVRLPAALCGVAGLRSRLHADIGLDGIIPLAPEFDQWGLMTANVEDLALVWSALHPGKTAPVKRRPLLVVPSDLHATMPDVSPEVEKAYAETLERAERAGFSLSRHSIPDVREWRQPRMMIQMRQALEVHRKAGWWPSSKMLYSDETRFNLDLAEAQADLSLDQARARLSELDGIVDGLLAGSKVIALPTTPVTAPLVSDIAAMTPRPGERHPIVGLLGQVTLPFSRPSLACLTVRCGMTANGLPLGLELIGTREADVFAAATPLEAGAA